MEIAGCPSVADGLGHEIYAPAAAFHCFDEATGRRVNWSPYAPLGQQPLQFRLYAQHGWKEFLAHSLK